MQTIRQTVRLVVQQRSNIPMRFAGRSTNKEKNLNQTKTGENKGKTTQIDDTKQPGFSFVFIENDETIRCVFLLVQVSHEKIGVDRIK